MPELSVVVPAFGERENIPDLLRALEQALAGLDWETIVVIDDAFDGTEDLVRERAQRDPRVRCIQRIGSERFVAAATRVTERRAIAFTEFRILNLGEREFAGCAVGRKQG